MIIGNIVQEVLSYKKGQFQEKMKSPEAFMKSTFHHNLQHAQAEAAKAATGSMKVGDTSAQTVTTKEAETLQVSQQEFDRRFQEVSNVDASTNNGVSVGSDKWGLTDKYNIQPIRSENEGKYTDIIEDVSEEYGVPKPLIQKMIEVESGFNPNVVSPAGAMGLMQIMPATAKKNGVKNPLSPEENIEAGVKEIAGYLDQYNGDLVLALAAYNAGPGNVKKYGGVPPFRETEKYIQKILNVDVTK